MVKCAISEWSLSHSIDGYLCIGSRLLPVHVLSYPTQIDLYLINLLLRSKKRSGRNCFPIIKRLFLSEWKLDVYRSDIILHKREHRSESILFLKKSSKEIVPSKSLVTRKDSLLAGFQPFDMKAMGSGQFTLID